MCNKQQDSNSVHTENNIPYKNCLNCATELNGMYCHICGQQATSKTPTVGAFILEYLNNAFIWDSQCIQTLWKLIRRPGYLTNEYLAGKFISQEHPLKLNMFLLFVIITLFAFFSGTEKITDSVNSMMNDEKVVIGIQVEHLKKNQEFYTNLQASPSDTVELVAPLYLVEAYPEIFTNLKTIEDTQEQGLDKWTAVIPQKLIEDKMIVPNDNGGYQFNMEYHNSKEERELIITIWTKMADLTNEYFPMLVLFTAPFLSMALNFVQRKNRLPRINHFIFSLHYTAFLELLMICIFVLHLTVAPPIGVLECFMIVSSCTYLTIAYYRVYKISTWIKAIAKALFTSLVYFFICLLIFIGIFFVACFFVADKFA